MNECSHQQEKLFTPELKDNLLYDECTHGCSLVSNAEKFDGNIDSNAHLLTEFT